MTTTPHSATTLAELLVAFAFAGDLAMGLELEDGIRSTYVACRIAEELRLSPQDYQTLYYTSLLKDAGCTCWTTPLASYWSTPDEIEARRELFSPTGVANSQGFMAWMKRYPAAGQPALPRLISLANVVRGFKPFLVEGFESTVEVCARISKRMGLPESVQEASLKVWEQWDGKGMPYGLKGDQIPQVCRVIFMTVPISALHRAGGPQTATEAARAGRGKAFDPDVADAFIGLAQRDEFWRDFESPDLTEAVLAQEPAGDLRQIGSGSLDDVAYAFADFVDLKSPSAAGHSRRVARIAQELATLMGHSDTEVAIYRQAGLLHDLGLSGVPSAALNQPASALTSHQREQLRLHPYYAERILDHTPALAQFKGLVGSHHERMDGAGYFRGLRGTDIPFGARLIAVANELDELTHDAPGAPALAAADALASLRREAGANFDPEIVAALSAAPGASGSVEKRDDLPAGLTSRELEVLRCAARGLTRKQIGQTLSISEATVRHHLEHVYDKTGTTTRVGAILFAMENDLLS